MAWPVEVFGGASPSAFLFDRQPFTKGDAERARLAQFGIALLADPGIDPLDELPFGVAGVPHVDEVVEVSVAAGAVSRQAPGQRQAVKRRAFDTRVEKLRSGLGESFVKFMYINAIERRSDCREQRSAACSARR